MTFDQSAVLELLESLKLAEVGDRVRQATETLYHALIDAELTTVIGAGPARANAGQDGAAHRQPAADADHDGG